MTAIDVPLIASAWTIVVVFVFVVVLSCASDVIGFWFDDDVCGVGETTHISIKSEQQSPNFWHRESHWHECPTSKPSVSHPRTAHRAGTSLFDEDEKNDNQEDNDDFEMFKKDFGRLLGQF